MEWIDHHLAHALDADDAASKNYHIRSAMQFRAAEDGGEIWLM